MTDPSIRERLRDYLCANGPTRPGEVAAACGVPLRVVMAEIDRGALRAAQTQGRPDGAAPASMTGRAFHSRRSSRGARP